ncbi:hypothetical protein [Marinilabilia salmonicolor]|uniref:hypothetical protein n=1 Tax=Marinilabilia salmonicolor TaxID=989 RepID=UPI00029A26BF|nr:hypothetical protein [Marinilabilia salmonicolor]
MSFALFACSEDENNTETNDDKNPSISLDEVSNGDGAYSIEGDAVLSGSGLATYYYNSAMKQDETQWSVHTVEIEDVEKGVVVTIDFYVLDAEANAFGGKLPEPGIFRVYEPGLSTPEDDYAKVNVYGDGLNSFFTTDEESQLELSVDSDGVWEASFSNVLDDYETDEVITLHFAFKAKPRN